MKKAKKQKKKGLTQDRNCVKITKLVARAASKTLARLVRTLKTIQNKNNANKTVIPNE